MRPYLAILKDSAREAIASRVLLVTLAGIVVVLLLLAPFGLYTETSTQLRRSELTRPERLVEKFIAGADEGNTPSAHLWSLLTKEQRQQARQLLDSETDTRRQRGPGGNPRKRDLVNRLNSLLAHEAFYKEDAWKDVRKNEELTSLLQNSALSRAETRRRNLLLLAAAFPGAIDIVDSNAISLYWFSMNVIGPIQLTPTEFEPIFDWLVESVVAVFLGFFGVFGCLLVTAGIIPRTFEQGEISLLLSKPVRRSGLFVTKFFGGCTFTLLYAAVLVIGIWLLLGLRMGFWRPQLLWCIPIYLFLFAIYYAVSALAGAVWRNAIVSICVVVIFWLGIYVLGKLESSRRESLLQNRGIREITMAGDHLITVDGQRNVYVWNSGGNNWQQIFREPPGQMDRFTRFFLASGVRFAPVYDAKNDRILALQQSQSRFGGLGSSELVCGTEDDEWERVSLGKVPEFTSVILISNTGRILLPTQNAIYEYTGIDNAEPAGGGMLQNLTNRILGSDRNFARRHPADMPDLGREFSAAIDLTDNALLIYGNGHAYRFDEEEDGRYSLTKSLDLESEESGVLAAGGRHVLLALADGQLLGLDAVHLEVTSRGHLAEGVLPRACVAAADGSSLAVLAHDQSVTMLQPQTGSFVNLQADGFNSISAIAWSPKGHVYLANGRLAVGEFESTDTGSEKLTRVGEWSEAESIGYQFYDYLIRPAWSILPKPSQLDQFVSFVMSGETSQLSRQIGRPPILVDQQSLEQDRQTFQPVQVLRDNGLFVCVILLLGCVYVSRRDF